MTCTRLCGSPDKSDPVSPLTSLMMISDADGRPRVRTILLSYKINQCRLRNGVTIEGKHSIHLGDNKHLGWTRRTNGIIISARSSLLLAQFVTDLSILIELGYRGGLYTRSVVAVLDSSHESPAGKTSNVANRPTKRSAGTSVRTSFAYYIVQLFTVRSIIIGPRLSTI